MFLYAIYMWFPRGVPEQLQCMDFKVFLFDTFTQILDIETKNTKQDFSYIIE